MKIIYPNYDNCLTNLVNSIIKNFNIKPYHKTLSIIDYLKDPVARMNVFLKDNEAVEEHYQKVISNHDEVNCFIMQDSGSEKKWIVINPRDVNKANTLKKLGALLNISLNDMIYFGDELNDLEVMEEVGLSVAMGNALDIIKEKATEVTKTNNEDGIIKFLDKKLNRQKVKK